MERAHFSSSFSLLKSIFAFLIITFHSPYSQLMLKCLRRLLPKTTAAKPLYGVNLQQGSYNLCPGTGKNCALLSKWCVTVRLNGEGKRKGNHSWTHLRTDRIVFSEAILSYCEIHAWTILKLPRQTIAALKLTAVFIP